MLIVILLSSCPLVFAVKFNLGDTVEVYNTGASGLLVRDAPAGNIIGKKYDGNRGTVLAGPQSASLGGVIYTWWKVRWADALEGWSAEDWLTKVLPDLTIESSTDIWVSPTTFYPGDTVTVYVRIKNIGAGTAISSQGVQIRALFDSSFFHQDAVEGLGSGYTYTFQWSYVWPSNTNTHTIQVTVDPNYYIAELSESNNVQSRSFAAIPPPTNQLFTLTNGYVSPASGDTSTTFNYYVTYSDPEGDVPTTKYVYIDGSPYTMAKISGDYVSGAVFRYSTTLSVGSHNYYFYFEDSVHGHTKSLPPSGAYPGPNVPPPDFSIASSPTSLTIQKGSSGTSTITITSMNGFNQPVQLTKSGVPSGVTATLNPTQVTPPVGGSTTSTLTVSVGTTATPGNYTLTVTGTSGALTHSTYISLEVTSAPPPPNQPPTLYNGYVSPSSGDTSTTFGYYVTYSDPEGDVPTTKYVYIDGSPYTMAKISGDYVSGAVFRYSTTLSAGSQNYYFYFEDSVHSHVVRLPTTGTYSGPNVSPPPAPDFSISASPFPSPLSIPAGGSDKWTLTITSVCGFSVPVQLSVSGVYGVELTYPIEAIPPPDGSVEVALEASVYLWAPPGIYDLTVTGTFGILTHTLHILLSIGPPQPPEISSWKVTNRYETSSFASFLGMINSLYEHTIDCDFDVFVTDYNRVSRISIRLSDGTSVDLLDMGLGHYTANVKLGEFSKADALYNILETFVTGPPPETTMIFPPEPNLPAWYTKPTLPIVTVTEITIVDTNINIYQLTESKVGQVLPERLPNFEDTLQAKLAAWNAQGGTLFLERCPVDFLVTDTSGRRVGALYQNGQFVGAVNEIPDAFYSGQDPDFQVIFIPLQFEDCTVQAIGRDSGTYTLGVIAFQEQLRKSEGFVAIDIQSSMSAVHNYTISWDALSLGEEGVTVEVDSDGNGVSEYTFTSGSELTRNEFLIQTGQSALYTFSIAWGEETFIVSVESNSTVGNFAFDRPSKEISLDATGSAGTGFCNVTIPKALLHAAPSDWAVLIDGVPLPPIAVTLTENATHSCLYFTYAHSTHTIQITGTWVIGPPTPPLSVSISPLSASLVVGQSVTFTSTVSGGVTPYGYQWYVNSAPVPSATSASWTFTPSMSGIYYVYLKATDASSNMSQSETARITAATIPVGGYSIPIRPQTKAEPVMPYIALIATLTAIFTISKRKTKRKR